MKGKLGLLIFIFLNFSFAAQTQVIGGIDQHAPGTNNALLFPEGCERLFEVIDPFPTGLATDGHSFWTSGGTLPYIYHHDLFGNLLDSLPDNSTNGYYGGALHYEDGYLWAVAEQVGTVYKIDVFSGEVVDTFLLPGYEHPDPNNFGFTGDEEYFWHSRYAEPNDQTIIFKMDKTDLSPLDSFYVNDPSLLGIVADGGFLYGMSLYQNVLFQINPVNGEVTDTLEFCATWVIDLCVQNHQLYGLSGQFSQGEQSVYQMEFLTTDIEEVLATTFSMEVFPNPASDWLTISSSTLNSPEHYAIYTVQGQKLLEGPIKNLPLTIDVNPLTPGMYWLVIRDSEGRQFPKSFVKQG